MKQQSPWSEVYAWFWINEKEILHHTQEDFDQKAKQIRDDGATIVIDFSLTHYRLAFAPYFDQIHEGIKMLADACHKVGLKLVEHHSASLVFDLFWSEGWKRLEADIGSFSDWKSDVYSWIDVPRYLIEEPMFHGKPLRSMFQIDGRTGKKAGTVYDSDCVCYNNPDYREAYFDYMRQLIECGIDGIMNDDVQYFGDGNACTCPHCRKKFKEQYGYELPQPADWAAFYGDYSNPVFVAWERFKRDSTRDFYHDLTDYYESLGAKLIRPNYVSGTLEGNPTAYGFDTCCDIWDNIYQENCFSTVIKASYPDYMIEAIHRFAAAARRGVVTMSQFYPGRADTVYFAWSLARAWGQLYTGTCEGVNITHLERKYREFERKYAAFYEAPHKLRDVSFYFSKQTRDFTKDASPLYQRPFMAGMQASYFAGLGTDMVFEDDSLEELLKHPCIVCSHIAMMSDEELSRLGKYAENGGKLVILGAFAIFDETNTPRPDARIIELLGANISMQSANYEGACEISYAGKSITLSGIRANRQFDGKYFSAVPHGKGEICWASFEMDCDEYQPSVWADRRQAVPQPEPAFPSRRAAQLSHTGALLTLLAGKKLVVSSEQDELFASAFSAPGGIAVHLVNLSDTVPSTDRMIGHDELVENFTDHGKPMPEVSVSLALPAGTEVISVRAHTPDGDKSLSLDYTISNGMLKTALPAEFFCGYALITMEA